METLAVKRSVSHGQGPLTSRSPRLVGSLAPATSRLKPTLLDQVRQALRARHSLSLPNRRSLRGLDQAIYLFPRQAPSGGDGSGK